VEETSGESHPGKLLIDATTCPQDIALPADLKLLNGLREKSETLIGKLFESFVNGHKKPNTYRLEAHARYLDLTEKKVCKRREIRNTVGQQLRKRRRKLTILQRLMLDEGCRELSKRDKRYLEMIMKVYEQQLSMYENGTHRLADRIVSIHQPYVRPS
jgi:IS5 family transposase